MFIYLGNLYPVQYCAHIVSMLAMFGQFSFLISVFSRQATCLRYIKELVLGFFVDQLHEPINLVPSAPYHLTR